MKGHTRIELTNVKTREKEVMEEDNLITNAANGYINTILLLYSMSSSYSSQHSGYRSSGLFPLRDSAFGGIKLFGSTIEENPNNYYLPNVGKHPVIGYAGSTTTPGTDRKRGSRNIVETTAIDNGVRIVWDFATSEANGTIASVCLTSGTGGTCDFPFCSDLFTFEDEGYSIVEYDETTNVATLISSTGSPLKIRRCKLHYCNIDLECVPNELTLIDERVVEGEAPSSPHYYKDSGDGYWYNITLANESKIIFNKVDKETLKMSSETITHNLSLESLNYFRINFAVHKGFLYAPASTHDKVYKIDLSNHSNIIEIHLQKWGSYYSDALHMNPLPNNMILANGLLFDINGNGFSVADDDYNIYGGSQYDFRTSIKDYCARFASILPVSDFTFVKNYDTGGSNTYTRICHNYGNLMSINNLKTPVTKTADKTMKITYTLLYENGVQA